MERDWERLGRAFAQARTAAGLTQVEAAKQLHVSRTPVQAIERGRQPNGKSFTKVTGTMRAYARLVGWTEDSPDRIADGGEPEMAPTPTFPEPESEPEKPGLPESVDRELRDGRTLDTAVIHLNPDDEDDDTRIILVLKGGESLSDEELDRRWQQWRKGRRSMQSLASDTDNSPTP